MDIKRYGADFSGCDFRDGERAALEAAEKELAERKKKLAELEQEEAEKQLARLVRKVGQDRAIQLLELAVKVKPKAAIEI